MYEGCSIQNSRGGSRCHFSSIGVEGPKKSTVGGRECTRPKNVLRGQFNEIYTIIQCEQQPHPPIILNRTAPTDEPLIPLFPVMIERGGKREKG